MPHLLNFWVSPISITQFVHSSSVFPVKATICWESSTYYKAPSVPGALIVGWQCVYGGVIGTTLPWSAQYDGDMFRTWGEQQLTSKEVTFQLCLTEGRDKHWDLRAVIPKYIDWLSLGGARGQSLRAVGSKLWRAMDSVLRLVLVLQALESHCWTFFSDYPFALLDYNWFPIISLSWQKHVLVYFFPKVCVFQKDLKLGWVWSCVRKTVMTTK